MCHMRRRIHVIRIYVFGTARTRLMRRIHVSYEEEDTCDTYIRVRYCQNETSVVHARGGSSEIESSPTRKRPGILQPPSCSERERERRREREGWSGSSFESACVCVCVCVCACVCVRVRACVYASERARVRACFRESLARERSRVCACADQDALESVLQILSPSFPPSLPLSLSPFLPHVLLLPFLPASLSPSLTQSPPSRRSFSRNPLFLPPPQSRSIANSLSFHPLCPHLTNLNPEP